MAHLLLWKCCYANWKPRASFLIGSNECAGMAGVLRLVWLNKDIKEKIKGLFSDCLVRKGFTFSVYWWQLER